MRIGKMNDHSQPSVASQFFRDFREKVNQKIFKKYELPWMKAKEFDIIEEVLKNLKPEYCFEWGSGFSTLTFPKLLPDLKLWQSIEHNKEWFELIHKKNDLKNVKINLIETDNPNFKNSTRAVLTEGDYGDFKTYVDYPKTLNQKFEFVFIDGRARKSCLKQAYDLVSDKGVVVVHDANRLEYFSDLPPFASTFILNDYRKPRRVGGVWVGRKTGDVGEILNMEYHRKIWRKQESIAKILFLR